MKFKESETVELKKSTLELKEAIASIVAMLNKHGKGMLYFGIGNDGTVLGQSVSENTVREISRAVSDHVEPKIYPKIKEIELDEKQCVQVEFSGNDRPYFAYGRAYMRVGDENKQVSARELERIILEKNKNKLQWDSEPSDYPLNAINGKLLKKYIRRANAVGRIGFAFDSKKSVLKKLGLLKEGKLLKATEVLFCNKNSLKVQLAVFAGNDKLTFLDIQLFEGTLFELLEKSEQYLKEKMNWRAEIRGLRREEIPEIPVNALREAIINSFCHRDYRAPESNYIAVYKNRVEISNPGSFPEGLTPQDFIKGKHRSVLRNPAIAEILYKSKEIEHWGSGLKRIVDECKTKKVKVKFTNLQTGFFVTFFRPIIKTQEPKGTVEKLPRNYPETTQKLLDAIQSNPFITRKELAKKSGLSEAGVKYSIKKLKKKKILKRIGGAKGGRWEVKK